MNVLRNIRALFGRKAPVDAPGDAAVDIASAENAGQPSPYDAAPPSNVVHIYSHGFTNGVFRIEPEKADFERFLEYCNHSDNIKDQQTINKITIAGVEDRLNKEKASFATDTSIAIEKEKLADYVTVTINELELSKRSMEANMAELNSLKKETHAEYAWAPSFLFLVAGITFIGADISITKQITAWGFNMTGLQGWIYAIGLAFTAFLIKPTIDRLFEKPFQASGLKLKVVYKIVLIGITCIGLVMLWLLGEFRSDSEHASAKLTSLTNQMSSIDPGDPKYDQLEAKYQQVQKELDENSNGQYGLVMSGLLFAVGGAICLSVAFGSLKQLIKRFWILPIQIGRLKRKEKGLEANLKSMKTELMTAKAEREKAQKRLLANEMALLGEELRKLKEEEQNLVAEFYRVQYERERALYLDGRSRGEKYTLDGELRYQPSGSDRSSLFVGKQTGPNGAQSPSPLRPYTRRPFVKMRKMIADNFSKNQNAKNDDGTEIEIVS